MTVRGRIIQKRLDVRVGNRAASQVAEEKHGEGWGGPLWATTREIWSLAGS